MLGIYFRLAHAEQNVQYITRCIYNLLTRREKKTPRVVTFSFLFLESPKGNGSILLKYQLHMVVLSISLNLYMCLYTFCVCVWRADIHDDIHVLHLGINDDQCNRAMM